MLTVNLEKKMLAINKPTITAKELLVLKEAETLASMPDKLQVLERVGLNNNVRKASGIDNRIKNINDLLAPYNKEKVFHIKQIESIANKYHLKFLPASRFNGTVDPQLAGKIETFEIAYNIRCNSDNTYIMAPASSFELEERPKDPLFFVKLGGYGSEYYYLVHKWGNDLSITRRILPFISSFFAYHATLVLISFFIVNLFKDSFGKPYMVESIFLLCLGYALLCGLNCLIRHVFLDQEDDFFRFIPKNNYNSGFRN